MGAQNFSFEIDEGFCRLDAPSDRLFDLALLEQAVEGAGFELSRVELALRGVLEANSGATGSEPPLLRIESSGQRFVLVEGRGADECESWNRLALIAPGAARTVLARGRVAPVVDDQAAIVLAEIEAVSGQ